MANAPKQMKAGKAHEILVSPWFSEKALLQTEHGVYTFAVPASANKHQIAKAVAEVYKVTPRKIRIVNLPSPRVSLRTRRGVALRAKRRKAYVYLKKGDAIQFA